jgi:hypothetical protein
MRLEALGDDVMAILVTQAPTGKHRLEMSLVEAKE